MSDTHTPGTRAVPVAQTAFERLDSALRPFVRPGTPVSFGGRPRLLLDNARQVALQRTAENGGLTNGTK